MSELESRVAEGLAGTAGRAPAPDDLASGARDRLRRRRRTTAAVVTAAAAVVAVPVAVALVGTPADEDPGGDSTVTETPSGWRTETWRDLSISVPPEWGWGGGRGWCADGRDLGQARQVSRPAELVPAIVCTPSYGYGAHFQKPSVGELPPGTEGAVQQYRGDRYPDGSWIGYVSTQSSAVWVVTDDRTTTRQVLDSATPVGEVDANGCATRLEMTAYSGHDRLSVCRFDGDGWLEQSELLTKEGSARAVAALRAAPTLDGGRPCSPGLTGDAPTIAMTGAQTLAKVVLEGPCTGIENNLDGLSVDRVTREVLYWALSPGWSGSVPTGAPDRLRTD